MTEVAYAVVSFERIIGSASMTCQKGIDHTEWLMVQSENGVGLFADKASVQLLRRSDGCSE